MIKSRLQEMERLAEGDNRELIDAMLSELHYRLPKEPVNMASDTVGHCPMCNEPVTVYSLFCSECGQRLEWHGKHETAIAEAIAKAREELNDL